MRVICIKQIDLFRLSIKLGEWIEVTTKSRNDRGSRGWPSLYGYESGKKIIYFMTIQDAREKKLKQLGM